ncbi:MAG: outer membrane beta-barrel protein [Hyphomicrobium sp.]
MTIGIRVFTLGALAMLVPAVASANDAVPTAGSGFYILGRIGTALPIDQDVEFTLLGKGEYDPDSGLGFNAAVGKHLGNGWRAEVSYRYLRGNDGEVKFDIGLDLQLEGHGESHNVMFNVLRTVGSFDTMFGTIEPFVGAGIGLQILDKTDIKAGAPIFTPPFDFTDDGTDTVFAAALHAGYEMQLRPGVALTSQWTLNWADEGKFSSVIPGFSTTRDAQVEVTTFTGLRFDLN